MEAHIIRTLSVITAIIAFVLLYQPVSGKSDVAESTSQLNKNEVMQQEAEKPVTAEPQTQKSEPKAQEPVSQPIAADVPERVFCGSPGQRTWKTPIRANVALGRDMAAAKGWTGKEWDALLELWSCESSWNNTAQNPKSTAYGIAQFLNSTWNLPGLRGTGCKKTSDAKEQIRCGLEYIAATQYKTPSRALEFHYKNNWY